MPDRLAGKTVIVTGAGNGVGQAVAVRFAQSAARVLLVGADDAQLEQTLATIREDDGEATAFACDATTMLGAKNVVAAAVDAYDRVDVLVNAEREVIGGAALETGPERLTEAFDANVRSAFQITQVAAKRMIAQAEEDGEPGRGGSVVNLTSIAARRTLPELMHYSVACAALDQLTRSMAVALAPHRIRVNAVALGAVMTASLREALRERAELREELTRVTPLGRIADVTEAAEAALFLASDAASFVTGQILTVDGGRANLDPLATPAL
ncbi:MAG: SDR family oxidoreductase [Pseudomonadota bacterium]